MRGFRSVSGKLIAAIAASTSLALAILVGPVIYRVERGDAAPADAAAVPIGAAA